MTETKPEPFWRNPSGAQIIVAIIGLIGAIAVAVIANNGLGKNDPTSEPTPPTPTLSPSAASPTSTPTAGPGTAVLSSGGISVRASSTLAGQGDNTYAAANTVDGDPRTAWSEGREGPGIGAALTWTLRRRVDLRRVNVLNGYAKGDLFSKNLRIRSARVTTAQGSTTATLKDTDAYQRLRVRAGPTDFVRLEILSVYGSRVYEDCLLSEAEFFVSSD